MSKRLSEKAKYIIQNSDFETLPAEEKEIISKYMLESKIETVNYMINSHKQDTTERWKQQKREYLLNLINSYNNKYKNSE